MRHMIKETITYSCRACGSINIVKNGTNKCGNQQYHCHDCGAYRVLKPAHEHAHPDQEKALRAYREGVSLRGVACIFKIAYPAKTSSESILLEKMDLNRLREYV